MNKKPLLLVLDLLFAGLLLAGCGEAATPALTATLTSPTMLAEEVLTPRPAASPTPTPDLVATGKARRHAAIQAQQTQNAVYQANLFSKQTEVHQARETVSAVSPTSYPTPVSTPTPFTYPKSVPVSSLPKCWSRNDWFDFVEGYYGYSICVPPSADISKNQGVEGVFLEDMPAHWNERMDYFHYLNITYPPGLRVRISYGSSFLSINVPDRLGGRYVDNFLGGLGEEDGFVWSWRKEDVIIGDQPYTATVLRQCESHDPEATCGVAEAYTVILWDGSTIRFGGGWDLSQARSEQYPREKVELLEMLRTYRSIPKKELYCPDPPAYSLSVGGFAYGKSEPPFENSLRDAPGINQDITGSIMPGEVVKLLEGPVCNNSMQWWKVHILGRNQIGWIPGSDFRSEWLIAFDKHPDCTSGWMRLKVGDRAQVSEKSNLPNRVRAGPSAFEEIFTMLNPGSVVQVIEGPVCADGLVFWRVDSASIPGRIGWTAEGDGKEYYLEPDQP